ncbi:HIRAN domain protein [Stieleria magnilauensis]|uniref:HIRAN domain protein n=2 Tax=Stieleria magnilauensis TaxID=2527963 RepID=A0ABX5XSJ3_9BACT|nr:HIRAN domain protein [Planctomycetes bacterium TBK1r]
MDPSMTEEMLVFICSYCEKPIRYQAAQQGRRGKCPKCEKPVVLVDNKSKVADDALSSSWFYQRMRLLRGREDVGPISDLEFLEMVKKGHIAAGDEVKSPELTKGKWVEVSKLKLAVVSERINQRDAERKRRTNAQIRQQKADQENRAKLKRGIRSAIESGRISSQHRQAIENFALAAGIPEDEVQETIASQSKQLIREVFEEALEDGILEPREEQQLSQLAISLGVELEFAKEDELRISVCRLAYELDSGNFVPQDSGSAPFKMGAKEELLAQSKVHWHEVVTLKRPAGIPLGGDNYLKEIGSGVAYLTTKQVSMVGALQSKKFTLSSVQRVTRYTDGVLFNRSSGKSVFVKMPMDSEAPARFALIAEHACSGEPVLGVMPSAAFIPKTATVDAGATAPNQSQRIQQSGTDPRYTFRVVGDFVGNRESYIRKLRPGDPIVLVREPTNEHDPHAVAVYDSTQHQLGYLKRDVAYWFSPLLGRKPETTAQVHCFSSEGSLIVGVYL